jgi:EmrB/QacA subfamily drug resistance transporter
MFIFGLAGFTLASLLCAIAPSVGFLIFFRFLQGFLGAMLLPQGFGLIRETFPPQEFDKAFAAYGPAFGLGGILGPIIGGFIIQANIADLGWRAVFLVNLPIGIAALILAVRFLPKSHSDKTLRIDVWGSLMVILASGMLVYPLIKGQDAGWPLWTYAMIVGSVVMYFLFSRMEKASAKRGHSTLIDPSIFNKRSYTLGLAGLALYFAAFTGVYLILTLFVQFGEHFTSSQAGLANIPIALGSAIGGGVSGGFLSNKIGGRRTLQIGGSVALVGAILLWFSVPGLEHFSIWQMVPALVVSGIGTGLIAAPLFGTILASVEGRQSGSASGVMSAVQSVFSSVGVAVFGTVFFKYGLIGQADQGFRNALLVEGILLVLFLAVSPAFPAREQH